MAENNKYVYYSYFCFDKPSKIGSVEGRICNLKSSTYSREDGQEFKKLNFGLICNNINNKIKYILDVEPAINSVNPSAIFIDCVAFGANAERLEKFLQEKDVVLATGALSAFEGANGNKINLKVQGVLPLKKYGTNKASTYNTPDSSPEISSSMEMEVVDEDDDEIPF